MNFHCGLVSISFRRYSVDEILKVCADAGLEYIEWGSDVHVPAGDAARADEVAQKTRAAGLQCYAYGSYFRVGASPLSEFPAYIDSAKRLGARVIRVWCGNVASAAATPELRARIVSDGRAIAQMAQEAGLLITLECHSGTLTDEYHSTVKYLQEVDHPAMRTYWQPSQFHSEEYNLEAARAMADTTEGLHVFHWDLNRRYPLAQGSEIWAKYLNIFRVQKRDIALLLEFMHDDNLETLVETARVLRSWI